MTRMRPTITNTATPTHSHKPYHHRLRSCTACCAACRSAGGKKSLRAIRRNVTRS